ncbi:hypothetical protein LSAJ18_120163 [Latilactobacillus sakei]|nr:hypothetical protein LSAJ18_120163 [Latilactobacillus sakei]
MISLPSRAKYNRLRAPKKWVSHKLFFAIIANVENTVNNPRAIN